jgi:hypothetical protein
MGMSMIARTNVSSEARDRPTSSGVATGQPSSSGGGAQHAVAQRPFGEHGPLCSVRRRGVRRPVRHRRGLDPVAHDAPSPGRNDAAERSAAVGKLEADGVSPDTRAGTHACDLRAPGTARTLDHQRSPPDVRAESELRCPQTRKLERAPLRSVERTRNERQDQDRGGDAETRDAEGARSVRGMRHNVWDNARSETVA